MNKLQHLSLLAAVGAACVLAGGPAAHAADVGVSIGISQPGVYGRIDIGQYPQPAIIAPQPILVQPPPPAYGPPPQPVYLWVPPAHRRHWARYCARYNACGAPVYFVREDWYRRHVAPPPPARPPMARPMPHRGPPVGPGPGPGPEGRHGDRHDDRPGPR